MVAVQQVTQDRRLGGGERCLLFERVMRGREEGERDRGEGEDKIREEKELREIGE